MERAIFLFFLCTVFDGDTGQHILVLKSYTWFDAQAFCRQHHTDLSFVSSQRDQDKLQKAAGGTTGWIGLHRDPKNNSVWRWSGGGPITYLNWATGQPDNYEDREDKALMWFHGKWNDGIGTITLPFFCITITAEGERKTWEEALKHCRESQTDLTSLLSETDHVVAKRVIQKVNITERVWIGLRYLDDGWLWVNGEPLVYQAWPQGGDQDYHCPIWNRCGTLTKEGLWENWDCQDKLNFICH